MCPGAWKSLIFRQIKSLVTLLLIAVPSSVLNSLKSEKAMIHKGITKDLLVYERQAKNLHRVVASRSFTSFGTGRSPCFKAVKKVSQLAGRSQALPRLRVRDVLAVESKRWLYTVPCLLEKMYDIGAAKDAKSTRKLLEKHKLVF